MCKIITNKQKFRQEKISAKMLAKIFSCRNFFRKISGKLEYGKNGIYTPKHTKMKELLKTENFGRINFGENTRRNF